jgi:hypothetical protein
MLELKIPNLSALIDHVWTITIPLGTVINTNSLVTEFRLPPNTIGQLMWIENQSPNANNVRVYVTHNDKRVPAQFLLTEKSFTKEDRPYYMNEMLSGDDLIRIYATNLTVPAANMDAIVRLAFWYMDWKLIENLKDNPEYSSWYEIGKMVKSIAK